MRDSALLVIDLQQEFTRRTLAGVPRSNPQAEGQVAALLAAFRARALPIVHIHHDDPRPSSGFRLDKPTGAAIAETAPRDGEVVFVKQGSSAFSGTGLDDFLRGEAIKSLVVVGAAVNFCVESSVRAARDLGYPVVLVTDAVFGFGATAPDGGAIAPQVVLDVTLGTLGAGFARLHSTAAVIAAL